MSEEEILNEIERIQHKAYMMHRLHPNTNIGENEVKAIQRFIRFI